jgi:photosystem II oxygen-evolving enhancer protein 3
MLITALSRPHSFPTQLLSPASPAAAAPAATRSARSAVMVRASAEDSRRAVLGGFLAGVAALTASSANAMDLIDDRAVRSKGFDIIYEARDLDLPQSQRDGMSQIRNNVGDAKSRIAESEKRIDSLEPFISKAYWTEAREQLRRQVGTLRFDINAAADTLPKEQKKVALAAKKAFLSEVDSLDFALRKKNKETALKELGDAKAALDAVLVTLS